MPAGEGAIPHPIPSAATAGMSSVEPLHLHRQMVYGQMVAAADFQISHARNRRDLRSSAGAECLPMPPGMASRRPASIC